MSRQLATLDRLATTILNKQPDSIDTRNVHTSIHTMITFTLAITVSLAGLTLAFTTQAATPVLTPTAILRRTVYTPTSSWDYATTAIPSNAYYLGAIKISDRNETCTSMPSLRRQSFATSTSSGS